MDHHPKKTKMVIGLMEDELDAKIMNEFVGLRANTYNKYLIEDDGEDKNKSHKKSVS